jgi:hypothetical protein
LKRYESKDPAYEAWIEVPDQWTMGDYFAYVDGYSQAQNTIKDWRLAQIRLAGILVLIQRGVVRVQIPGLVIGDGEIDITKMEARAVGALISTIAEPLEATQHVPLALVAPSETSSTAASKEE